MLPKYFQMIDFIVIERMQAKAMPENDLQENEFI
jgi:hypothetical protein